MSEECFVVEGKMALPYQYFAGATGSKFIVALRDSKKILAVHSERDGMTYVPPRSVSDRSFEDLTNNWVELSGEGEVTNYTVVRYSEPYQPKEPPYVLALIKLDGTDTPLAHLVDVAPEEIEIGMRVRAVFSEEPKNNILEIKHFARI